MYDTCDHGAVPKELGQLRSVKDRHARLVQYGDGALTQSQLLSLAARVRIRLSQNRPIAFRQVNQLTSRSGDVMNEVIPGNESAPQSRMVRVHPSVDYCDNSGSGGCEPGLRIWQPDD